MASSPMRAVVRLAWERVFPPSWVEVRLSSVSPGCGFPRPHGIWTASPIPSRSTRDGRYCSLTPPPGVAHNRGWTGQSPCQFIACRLAYGQRSCAGRRKFGLVFGSSFGSSPLWDPFERSCLTALRPFNLAFRRGPRPLNPRLLAASLFEPRCVLSR